MKLLNQWMKSFVAIVVAALFFFSQGLLGQSHDPLWISSIPIGGNLGPGADRVDGQQTHDGGYIVGGSYKGTVGEWGDLHVIKYTPDGDIEWREIYRRPGGLSEYSTGIVQTDDNGDGLHDDGYIVAARTGATGGGQPDFLLLKLDSTGGIQWANSYDTGDIDHTADVIQVSDGSFVVVGHVGSPNGTGVIKVDAQGEIVWSRRLVHLDNHLVADVVETDDGAIVVAATAWGGHALTNQHWLTKLSQTNGATIWSKKFGMPANLGIAWRYNELVEEMAPTADGGFVLVGTLAVQSINVDGNFSRTLLVTRVDSAGNVLWSNNYANCPNTGQLPAWPYYIPRGYICGQFQETVAYGHGVTQTPDLGFLVVGTRFLAPGPPHDSERDTWLLKLNALGEVEWQKTYDLDSNSSGDDRGQSVKPTSDGGYLITGDPALRLGTLRVDAEGNTSGDCEFAQTSPAQIYAWALDSAEQYDTVTNSPNTFQRFSSSFITPQVNLSNEKMCYVEVANQAPTAVAGADPTVNEGDVVTLDASSSSDPEGDSLDFLWTQVGGFPVWASGTAEGITVEFVAPQTAVGGETLTFSLEVSDGINQVYDEVNVNVSNVNNLPIAIAGDPQTVSEGAEVQLDGSESWDPDDEQLSFEWEQVQDSEVTLVTLSNIYAASPSFTAPIVGPAGDMLEFKLTVSDGIDSASALTSVYVENVNHPPVANTGDNQTVDEGAEVTLDGSDTSDPDSDMLSYLWQQTAGTSVVLPDPPFGPTVTFDAPYVSPGGETLTFLLTVSDGLLEDSDTVNVNVQNVNDPPLCVEAAPVPETLWPPNHKLKPVEIVGVADPNNDSVTITMLTVTQDEPVNGLGDGDTSPDAALSGETLLIRSERQGGGNGRVYWIEFAAEDGQGGSCVGTVPVCVPHDRKRSVCTDDGNLYDSFLP